MPEFNGLVNYVRTNMNLIDFEVNGRYVKETFDDGFGREVRVDVWDNEPQVVYRPGLAPVYRDNEDDEVEA